MKYLLNMWALIIIFVLIGDEKENFNSQTFNTIYYFPISYENIAGFTYKKLGLIFITNFNRFDKLIHYKNG